MQNYTKRIENTTQKVVYHTFASSFITATVTPSTPDIYVLKIKGIGMRN